MSEKQQTAVEWIEGYLKQFNHVTESLSLTKAFEQAKAMEKQQIIDAYLDGYCETAEDSQDYYSKTYSK